MDLDLEVKAFRESTYRCSSLGCRVRVDLIGRDYEWEISEILLMVDPGIGCHSLALLRARALRHRVESGVVARYGHSPLLVSVDGVCL